MEIWLPVVGFEDLYEVSSEGRVRSKDRLVGMIISGTKCERLHHGRVRKLTPDKLGYAHLSLKRQGLHVRRAVHILVCEAFHGPRPNGMEAAHKDGNPRNASAENVRWLTRSQNNLEKANHGTLLTRDTGHGYAKVTSADIREMLRLVSGGEKVKDVAGRFGIRRDYLSRLLRPYRSA